MKILLAMILTIVWAIFTVASAGAAGDAFDKINIGNVKFKEDFRYWLFFTSIQSASMFICGFLACGFLQ